MSKIKSTDTKEILLSYFGNTKNITFTRNQNICFAYDRVSSRDQAINGNSLSWQIERIKEHATKNNLTIKGKYGGTYESAKTDERKEFKRMLEDIKKDSSVGSILVYSYDRFSRSGPNCIFLVENLMKIGVRIVAVSQEIDSSTPTGKFQEQLLMLLGKFDNDMRKDKCVSGTKSILRKGCWPYGTPIGYTNTNKFATADKHVYEINETGKLIQKAFQWKASGKYSNKMIIDKLKRHGVKLTLRNMARILSNPFYCGYILCCLLPGECIDGKHPALIDEDTFLKANSISRQNARTGVPKNLVYDELPLKVFMKDAQSGSAFTGYFNKQKSIYYYKSREQGTKVNVAATKLNKNFESILQSLEIEKSHKTQLKTLLEQKLRSALLTQKDDMRTNKKKYICLHLINVM